MQSNLSGAEVYRREAQRLRSLAQSSQYKDVRDGFLDVARQYDILAEQAEEITSHSFGQPLTRPGAGHPRG
jgi:hypothetical protein